MKIFLSSKFLSQFLLQEDESMKKLYYELLMIGSLIGMQSISYGAAAPVNPKKVSRELLSFGLCYAEGKVIDWHSRSFDEIVCIKTIDGRFFASRCNINPKTGEPEYTNLENPIPMFNSLESKFNKQSENNNKEDK